MVAVDRSGLSSAAAPLTTQGLYVIFRSSTAELRIVWANLYALPGWRLPGFAVVTFTYHRFQVSRVMAPMDTSPRWGSSHLSRRMRYRLRVVLRRSSRSASHLSA